MPNELISRERKRALFRAAQVSLREHLDPFSFEWREDYGMTMIEMAWLSETIADAMEYTARTLNATARVRE